MAKQISKVIKNVSYDEIKNKLINFEHLRKLYLHFIK